MSALSLPPSARVQPANALPANAAAVAPAAATAAAMGTTAPPLAAHGTATGVSTAPLAGYARPADPTESTALTGPPVVSTGCQANIAPPASIVPVSIAAAMPAGPLHMVESASGPFYAAPNAVNLPHGAATSCPPLRQSAEKLADAQPDAMAACCSTNGSQSRPMAMATAIGGYSAQSVDGGEEAMLKIAALRRQLRECGFEPCA